MLDFILDLRDPNLSKIPFKQFLFKSGEYSIKLGRDGCTPIPSHIEELGIFLPYNNDGKLIGLAMVVDAIRNERKDLKLHLLIPYFPGGRQDRLMDRGEAFSLRVYADFINSLNFDRVVVLDPHSDVTAALVKNIKVVSNHRFVRECLYPICLDEEGVSSPKGMVLVSPDAGSNKKIYKLAQSLGFENVIRADKLRDTKTGKIVETTVYTDDLKGKPCLIVDDICSKGGTFMALAEKLKEKNAGNIYLIVSHWEGVADEAALKKSGIKRVFCTDSICRLSENLGFVFQMDSKVFLNE